MLGDREQLDVRETKRGDMFAQLVSEIDVVVDTVAPRAEMNLVDAQRCNSAGCAAIAIQS